jgi:dihydrofolate reductase
MIRLIAVVDSRWGISKNGEIPWSFPEDRRFFREKTTNGVVVMGKNTFLSMHCSPLKNRENCVISRTMESTFGVKIFRSLEDVIAKYSDFWLIGGAMLYNYALKNNLVQSAIITHVDADYDADKSIDPYDLKNFSKEIVFDAKEYTVICYQ